MDKIDIRINSWGMKAYQKNLATGDKGRYMEDEMIGINTCQ